jgi:hypothetical protein
MSQVKTNWVSATSVHHYFNEPLLDWFKYAHKPKSTHKKINYTQVKDYLCKQGDEFEKKIINLIIKKMGKKNVHTIDSFGLAQDDKKAKETLDSMKKGHHIILGGVLHDTKHKCYGLPDILIRSDIINKLIDKPVVDKQEQKCNAQKLGKQKWHYRVIDIKFMTLPLKSNQETLLNTGHIPAYKAQLYIYNRALGVTQGYTPDQAYLLGRRWVCQKNGVQLCHDYCFNKLGVIDYEHDDASYCESTQKAIDWINLCKTKKAKKWNVFKYPLDHENLYPNMSNQWDGEWKELKNKIAKDNYELTQLWQVGKKHRAFAIKRGIYSWKDKRCKAKNLNVGGKTGETLDKMIKINQSKKSLIQPSLIKNNEYDWQKPDKIEFFVDFEYKNAVFDQLIQLPIADKSILLFTIGVGYMHPKKYKWVYKNFTVDHLIDTDENTICVHFINYIYKKTTKYNNNKNIIPKCWHWSTAEPTVFNNMLIKHIQVRQCWKTKQWQWCDLLKIFHHEPIVINGALNFKLKTIAKAMYQHGFISTIWDEAIEDGQMAMIHTIQADEHCLKNKKCLKTNIVNVIRYNEIDVKVLQEILHYLRYHLTKNGTDKNIGVLKRQLIDGPCFNTRSKTMKII